MIVAGTMMVQFSDCIRASLVFAQCASSPTTVPDRGPLSLLGEYSLCAAFYLCRECGLSPGQPPKVFTKVSLRRKQKLQKNPRIMKLLTHNLLKCNVKGVKTGYPLKIEVTSKEVRETEMNPTFLQNIVNKLDWAAFRAAAAQLGEDGFPEAVTPELLEQDEFLEKFHRALLETVVVEGALICPESGRRFPITNAIPNMILNEDEV